MEDADRSAFDLQHNPLACHMVRDEVGVGIIRETAVFMDLSEELDRGIVIGGWTRPEKALFFLPAFVYGLMVGTVYSSIGAIEPDHHIVIGLRE